jgi:hypothetical protein
MPLLLSFVASIARADDLFAAGPDDLGDGNGISVADANGDGWVDIVVPSASYVWFNDAGLGWVRERYPWSGSVGVGAAYDYGASLADYDGDGLPDLVNEPRAGEVVLLRNIGGTFELFEGQWSAPDEERYAETAAWADVDGDGRLDVFVPAYYGESGFWLNFVENSGATGFQQMAHGAGLVLRTDEELRPEGAQFVDLDRDGDPDLYVCGEVFQNQSTPGDPFFEAQPASGIDAAFDEGAAFADLDLDGDFDLGVLYMDHVYFEDRPVRGMSLWENLGDGTFAALPPERVEGHDDLGAASLEEGMSFADWDNDGDPDLTFAHSFLENQWRETGDVSFTLFETSAATDDTLPAWFDADQDGDLDIARASFFQAATYFENTLYDDVPEAERRALRVRVVGDSDTSDIGVEDQFATTVDLRVAGEPPELRRRQFVASGHGYLNQSEYALTFGLEGAGASTVAVSADFPNAADAGAWRIDRHIQPALATVDVTSRALIVFRSGAAILDGTRYEPDPVESPLLVTADGVPPSTSAELLDPLPEGTWIGVEVHVPVDDDVTRVAALREVLVEGVLTSPVTCGAAEGNVLVWDVTPGSVALVATSTGAVLPSNRRVDVGVDARLTQGHTYRVLARVASARQLPAGTPGSWVQVNGALTWPAIGACDAAAITQPALDPATRTVSVRWRERSDGTADEVYAGPTEAPDKPADDAGNDAAEGCACSSPGTAVGDPRPLLALALAWGARRRRGRG